MFQINEFVEFLKSEFPEGVVASNGAEFVCRCRLCGDSATNPYKMRFYISLNHPSGLIFFNCFNCGAGGLLTPNRLRQLCEAPVELLLDLGSYNKMKSNSIGYNTSRKIYVLKPETILDDDINRGKLEYFNKRLGLDLTYLDLISNKIVLSLASLIKNNNLALTRHASVVKELDTFFIGAIGMNNSTVNLRNLNQGGVLSSIDKKYVNYRLIQNDDPKRFYAIPTISNYNKTIRVNIAEGMFDINSIFYNLRDSNRQNELYISVGSKAYTSAIKIVLEEFGLLDAVFHIYFDNDVEEAIYDRIKELCGPLQIPVYQHHNTFKNEKDYGVPLSRIKDSSKILVKGW